MKAEEIKAKELVDKYESLLFEELEYGYNKELPIQCAIICVEEILKTIPVFSDLTPIFWQEVLTILKAM